MKEEKTIQWKDKGVLLTVILITPQLFLAADR